jgi:WD40 repeat protein
MNETISPVMNRTSRGLLLVAALWLALASTSSMPACAQEGPADAVPPKSPETRTDRYGDPLPKGAINRFGTTRFRHRQCVTAIAYSPDGTLIATASRDGTLRVWDAKSGRVLSRFDGISREDRPQCIQFAPGGRMYAVGAHKSSNLLFLVETSTGKVIHQLSGSDQKFGVWALAFSPDGTQLAAASEETIRFWHVETGKQQFVVKTSNNFSETLLYTPDGTKLLSGGSTALQCWDTKTAKEVADFRSVPGEVNCAALSTDNRILAVGTRTEVLLFDRASGKLLHQLQGHGSTVKSIAFAPKNDLLYSCTSGGCVHTWSLRSFQELHRFSCNRGYISSYAFSPDRLTLATGATSLEKAVRFWDLERGREREEFLAPHSEIRLVEFVADGKLAVTSFGEPKLWLWDYQTGVQSAPLVSPEPELDRLTIASDRSLIAFANSTRVRIRDLTTQRDIHTFTFDATRHQCLDFSPDGKVVALAEEARRQGESGIAGIVHLYSIPDGKLIATLPESRGSIRQLRFSPDGRTLAIAGVETRLWDMRSRRFLRPLKRCPPVVEKVVFSSDGNFIALVPPPPQRVTIWETGTGRIVDQLQDGVVAVFHPNGRSFVVGDHAGKINWYNLGSEQPPFTLSGHESAVVALAFSSTGSLLASGSWDTTVLLWDARVMPSRDKDPNVTQSELEELWSALASEQAPVAMRAAWRLTNAGDSADEFLLRKSGVLAPRQGHDPNALVAQLSSDEFETREAASRQLEALSIEAEEALLQAYEHSQSAEARRRVDELLTALNSQPLPATTMRHLRTIRVLELRASPTARAILTKLAEGPPGAPQTREAKRALDRLQAYTAHGK